MVCQSEIFRTDVNEERVCVDPLFWHVVEVVGYDFDGNILDPFHYLLPVFDVTKLNKEVPPSKIKDGKVIEVF